MTIAELLEQKDKEIECLRRDLAEADRRLSELTRTATDWMEIATTLKQECIRLSKGETK